MAIWSDMAQKDRNGGMTGAAFPVSHCFHVLHWLGPGDPGLELSWLT